ncbi:MAG: hypothetical protein ACO22K_11945 [Woeseiaceae bacterium]|jgi:hypothetical protein
MIKTIRKTMFILALGASSMMMASGALAQEWPLAPGDYWEVTGIDIKDGGGLKYAEWLASEWRENLEFSKSQGWIKDFMILSNVHARSDEPDLYLVTVTESLVSAAEGQERMQEYMEWRKKTLEQMVSESGNRAEYREVMSESLLRVLSFRD